MVNTYKTNSSLGLDTNPYCDLALIVNASVRTNKERLAQKKLLAFIKATDIHFHKVRLPPVTRDIQDYKLILRRKSK